MKAGDLLYRKDFCVGYDGVPLDPILILDELYLKVVPAVKYFLVLENENEKPVRWQESVLEKYFDVISSGSSG